jgi:hypothetical protein
MQIAMTEDIIKVYHANCLISRRVALNATTARGNRHRMTAANRGATMTVTESKSLKKGTRVYWRGDAADGGIVTETSWDAVTIAWDNGKVASVHHGDMREIQRVATKSPRRC